MPNTQPETPPTAPAPQQTGRRSRPSRWRLLVLGAGLAVLVVAALVVRDPGPEGGGAPTPVPPTADGEAVLPQDYPFSDVSVWRQDISDAPLAENSAEQVSRVAQQVADHYDGVAAFNVNRFQVSFYTVDADQPRVDVHWNDCQKKGYTPQGLKGEDGQFSDVPIPDGARPAVGTDGQLTIWSPETDELWEFWKAEQTEEGWQACWGGRIDEASESRGYFRNGFGAAGTGLALSGGMVWVDDAEAGVIDHALSLQLIDARHWKTFSWPAQRSDGRDTDPDAVQEGTRLRLDPSVDVDALDLNPVAAMIARAAQKYGFIVTDRAGSVSITAEAGQETAGDADPWPALLEGTDSWDVMRGFPWEDLQALPRNYGKPASTATPSATSSAAPTR